MVKNTKVDADEYKAVTLEIDAPDMCIFKMDHLSKAENGYVYEDWHSKNGSLRNELIVASFPVHDSYQILGLLDGYWGDWNATPNPIDMQNTAKEWYEKYDAELVKISHDTLTFRCRKLSDQEAKELVEEVKRLYAMILDCKPDEWISHLMHKGTFTLWWD